MTKEIEAYRAAVQMAQATGVTRPKPETFGLTEADVAAGVAPMDPAVAKTLETMFQATGATRPKSGTSQ